MEVAVAGAFFHCRQTAHATVCLETTALEDFEFARRLIRTSQHTAQHDGMSTGSHRFDDVSRILDSAVSDNCFAVFSRHTCSIIDSCDLRNTNTSYDTGRTDRARSDSDFDYIDSDIKQSAGSFCSRYISGNQGCVRELIADFFNFADNAGAMAMRCVDDDCICTGIQ
ncbi:hypothetical protein SDC9_131971 [bioreactor metagenome]|uniref:Uncharacterized protein n=1 Tax=bioreactor metagenome TaxID=1076179 RepID=A0A645D6R6_9ZZZZ